MIASCLQCLLYTVLEALLLSRRSSGLFLEAPCINKTDNSEVNECLGFHHTQTAIKTTLPVLRRSPFSISPDQLTISYIENMHNNYTAAMVCTNQADGRDINISVAYIFNRKSTVTITSENQKAKVKLLRYSNLPEDFSEDWDTAPPACSGSNYTSSQLEVIILATLGSVTGVAIIAIIAGCVIKRLCFDKQDDDEQGEEEPSENRGNAAHAQDMPSEEIKNAWQ